VTERKPHHGADLVDNGLGLTIAWTPSLQLI